MKRFFAFLFFFAAGILISQERSLLDIEDIDSLFDFGNDQLVTEIPESKTESQPLSPVSLVKRRGFTFTASYYFAAGIAPGWSEAFWFDTEERIFSWSPLVSMNASFDLDSQISEIFRVKSTLSFSIPGFGIALGDFFFDYNLYEKIFIRAGKYNLSCGISPNYGFTNLLARVPNGNYAGDSFILKADIPLGIGGFQFLAMTRANLIGGVQPGLPDFGFGIKYNLALRRLDLDTGYFYQENMPMRGFLSLKTTIGTAELYNEWLLSADFDNSFDISGAVNLGFARDFFGGKFSVNGELFYNAEGNSFWYTPETDFEEAKVTPFMENINATVNLLYRFDGKGSPRVFLQTQYAPVEYSARLIPGFRLSPWPNVEFYLTVPVALGNRKGYYYRLTDPRELGRPFSVVLLFTLNGSVRFGHYY